MQSVLSRTIIKQHTLSSCLHRASIVSRTLFVVATDAHYYKIIEILKQFKIIILANSPHQTNDLQTKALCTTCRNHMYNLELLMIGIIVPEIC